MQKDDWRTVGGTCVHVADVQNAGRDLPKGAERQAWRYRGRRSGRCRT